MEWLARFFFNDTATTEIYTLSLHDALPILLSGPSTFVLSYSGHIQSLVNPPGNPKAHYWTDGKPGPDPHAWRASAQRHTGSWWEAWAEWMLERSGAEVPAPTAQGSADHPALEPAPGSYVLDRRPQRSATRTS